MVIPHLVGAVSVVSLSAQVNKLLRSVDEVEQGKIITQILKEEPSPDTLISILKGVKFKKPEKTGIIARENLCIDGVERPYYLYVPSNYDPNKENPLLIYLHGGVSRKELVEDFAEHIKESPFAKMADENGYILIFPLGQHEATWWDSVGISNVLQQIRKTKQDFNIDDNRVFMTGFSDGGSGSFLFAMCYPSDFAGFLPLNGHPGVSSEVGEIQTYFINLFNRPVYVINTDEDELYPAEEIRSMMELAHSAGADILYRIYTGIGHDFDYADEEMPCMVKFMESNARYLRPLIKWESAYPGLGCMWLSIGSITDEGHADWYEDHNMELIDDRVMFGFYPDETYEGSGVGVDKVIGDSTLCALAGIQDGDIIIRLEGKPVNNLEDVNKYKEGKKCGDWTEITILRNGEELEFKERFPGPTKYDLFKRGKPSARIEGYFCGNKFSFEASQVGAFTIYIHPDMVQLKQNVVVEVNGKKVFDKKVNASPEFILRNFLKNRDRELIYVNKVTLEVDSR